MDTIQNKPNPSIRRVFTVFIYDKPFDVFDIQGKEHDGYNDTIKTWWVYFAEPPPDGITPPIDSEYWKPLSVGTQRRVWEVKIKQTNTTKEKWGDTDFRSHTAVQMWCNTRLVYEFGTTSGHRGFSYALAKIQYLQVQLEEHCYNFFEPETEKGRKIWWYGLPATVQPKSDGWEIGIKPDYTAGMDRAEWWKEYTNRTSKMPKPTDPDAVEDMEMEREDFEEDMESDYINWGDALSDKHINWFRK